MSISHLIILTPHLNLLHLLLSIYLNQITIFSISSNLYSIHLVLIRLHISFLISSYSHYVIITRSSNLLTITKILLPPRLFVHFSDIPFFLTLSKYLNNVLIQCDIQSDSEYKHCCTEILTLINTLKAWSLQYQTVSGRMKDKAWLRDLLNGFLSLLDITQIIRVAKTLGQYEYALR